MNQLPKRDRTRWKKKKEWKVNRGTKPDENKKKKNTGSSFAEIGQVIKDWLSKRMSKK